MGSLKFKKLQSLIEERGNAANIFNVCDYFDGEFEKIAISNHGKTNIYSLSKNITSLCIGILMDQGALSLDEDIYDIFRDEYPSSISYKGVSIKDVLHQVSGIKRGFLDVDCDPPSSFCSDDYLQIVFDTGVAYNDKSHFVYSDSNYYLLGRVVEKKASTKLDEFIVANIFSPLGIADCSFQYDPKGHQMGATGIFVDSLGVAKIGSIFLNEGMYKKKRIVSSEYVRASMNDLIDVDANTQYGYSIWVDKKSGIRHGNGMLGQTFVLLDKEVISMVSEDAQNKIGVIKDFLLSI